MNLKIQIFLKKRVKRLKEIDVEVTGGNTWLT